MVCFYQLPISEEKLLTIVSGISHILDKILAIMDKVPAILDATTPLLDATLPLLEHIGRILAFVGVFVFATAFLSPRASTTASVLIFFATIFLTNP